MSSQNPVKGVFDGVCSIGKFFSPLYPYLPLLYAVITIIFMILGFAGGIAIVYGIKKFISWKPKEEKKEEQKHD